MKQVLNKFVATEGVLGAYILNPEEGVLESDMPRRFSQERLRQIGRNLLGIADLARSDFSDPEEISFFFESAALRIQDFNEGYHLISLFSPEMERDVLDKAAETFINEYRHPRTLSLVTPLDGGQGRKIDEQSAGALSPEDLMSSETLAGPLEIMQSALFKVVGPMAKIVFYDALERWLMLDTPSMDNLPLLADIVLEEIGDADLANGFKERLPSFCCSPSPNLLQKTENVNNLKAVQNL